MNDSDTINDGDAPQSPRYRNRSGNGSRGGSGSHTPTNGSSRVGRTIDQLQHLLLDAIKTSLMQPETREDRQHDLNEHYWPEDHDKYNHKRVYRLEDMPTAIPIMDENDVANVPGDYQYDFPKDQQRHVIDMELKTGMKKENYTRFWTAVVVMVCIMLILLLGIFLLMAFR